MSIINEDISYENKLNKTIDLMNIHLGEYKDNKIIIEDIIFYISTINTEILLIMDTRSIYPIEIDIHQNIRYFFEGFLYLKFYLSHLNTVDDDIIQLVDIKSRILQFKNKFNPRLYYSCIGMANEWFKKADTISDKREKFNIEYFSH
jgi:hypothetical protein